MTFVHKNIVSSRWIFKMKSTRKSRRNAKDQLKFCHCLFSPFKRISLKSFSLIIPALSLKTFFPRWIDFLLQTRQESISSSGESLTISHEKTRKKHRFYWSIWLWSLRLFNLNDGAKFDLHWRSFVINFLIICVICFEWQIISEIFCLIIDVLYFRCSNRKLKDWNLFKCFFSLSVNKKRKETVTSIDESLSETCC